MVRHRRKRKTNTLAAQYYLPRIIAHFYVFIIMLTVIYQEGYHLAIGVVIALQGLIWPHIAFQIAKDSRDPSGMEAKLLWAEGVMFGILLALASFNPWVLVILTTIIGLASYYVGGKQLLLQVLSAVAIPAAATFIVLGFNFSMQANIFTIILCVIAIVALMGYLGFTLIDHQSELTEITQKLQQSKRDAAHISEVIQTASSTLELDECMKPVIRALREIFNFNIVIVQLVEKDHRHLKYSAIYGKNVSKNLLALVKNLSVYLEGRDSISIDVFKRKESYKLEYVTPQKDMKPVDKQLYEASPFQSVIMFPLIFNNKSVGVIHFYSNEQRLYLSEDDALMIKQYMLHVSSVINNVRLYNKSLQSQKEANEKNKQLELLSSQLSRYLSPQVYDMIFSGKKEVTLDSQRKRLTVFFSDIKGFTELTDTIESEVLTTMLNNYLNIMSKIALKYGGTIDKYIGDAIMVFFGDPESRGLQKDAIYCVMMAIEMVATLVKLKKIWNKQGIAHELQIRVGINSGYCTVGNFGSSYKMDYTLIGGNVNLASRLESNATPGRILISEDTHVLIKDHIECEKADKIMVKGIAHAIQTYNVVGVKKKAVSKKPPQQAEEVSRD